MFKKIYGWIVYHLDVFKIGNSINIKVKSYTCSNNEVFVNYCFAAKANNDYYQININDSKISDLNFSKDDDFLV